MRTAPLLAALLGCGGPARDAPAPPAAPAAAEAFALPSGPGAITPSFATAGDDLLYVWQEPAPASPQAPAADAPWRVRFARLHAGAWSAPVDLVAGAQILANWADFPAVAAAPDGSLVAHWLERTVDAYDFALARSTDGGATWSPLPDPYPAGLGGERGFVSYARTDMGLAVYWLDGRAMSGGHGDAHAGATALHTAVLQGGVFAPEWVVDDRTCDCCATDAVTTWGRGLVVYRDRDANEVRDIAAAHTASRTPVAADGWTIQGCPVNGPAVDAYPGSGVVTGWFTGARDAQAVRAAFSGDGGITFGPAVTVVEAGADARPLGRVDVLVEADRTALVSWISAEGDDGTVRVRRVAPDGRLGEPRALGAAGTARATGFPRLARHDGRVVAAWTVPGVGNTAVAFDAAWVPEATAPAAPPAPAAPTRLPDFAATDLAGAPVSAAALRGAPVLLNVWATWCGPCREELPVLDALQRAHPELRVLALSVDGAAAAPAVRKLAEARAPGLAVLHPDPGLAARLGVTALPRTFLFDGEGALVWSSTGVVAAGDPALAAALAALE